MTNDVNMENTKKLSRFINGVMIVLVLVMLLFFYYFKIKIMVYASYVSLLFYLISFFIIEKEMLALYVWGTYGCIISYMGIATVCLGYNCGFHLYCMSMIPIIFHLEYLSKRLKTRSVKPFIVCGAIIFCYLFCVIYAAQQGSIYETEDAFVAFFLIYNSAVVFALLILYMNKLVKMVTDSENKLTNLAHKDRLTGMYNRHYMIENLDNMLLYAKSNHWLAMIDVDDFKKINDTYGHNCGDYVLKHLCEIMTQKCENCIIARWGGEEFLILGIGENDSTANLLEGLRSSVENEIFTYEEQRIRVTITIGVAFYGAGESVDQWVQVADQKLYIGKKAGKNRVSGS